MATYKDIQRETGLSLATISKYFNGRTVLESNRVAIEAAAAALDFRPNAMARGLRSRRSGTIGVVLPALNNDFHLTIIAGVEAALRSAGINVIVAASPSGQEDTVGLLLSQMVDGIIAVPSGHDIEPLRTAMQRVPVVLIDWAADELHTDGVFLDNAGAGAMAARLLLDHGHRRIALVAGHPSVSTMRLRASGFTERLAEAGVAMPPEYRASGPLVVRTGHDSISGFLAMRDRPTAIFCANYELTLGALIAINESGLRLGRDISLVGFDGAELAQATVPRLTVIAQPTQDIATGAAELLRRRLDASGPPLPRSPVVRILPAQLVPGGSVERVGD
jgi:LacI family transcriptional regulator